MEEEWEGGARVSRGIWGRVVQVQYTTWVAKKHMGSRLALGHVMSMCERVGARAPPIGGDAPPTPCGQDGVKYMCSTCAVQVQYKPWEARMRMGADWPHLLIGMSGWGMAPLRVPGRGPSPSIPK